MLKMLLQIKQVAVHKYKKVYSLQKFQNPKFTILCKTETFFYEMQILWSSEVNRPFWKK